MWIILDIKDCFCKLSLLFVCTSSTDLKTYIRTTDLNYWIKLLSCIIEANGGHIGLSHINLHWYY